MRIGGGAGSAEDRIPPALELAEHGELDYLVFECLAERTVSRENLARSKDPNLGYSPSLHARLRMMLPTCIREGIRIVSNMGAANPLAAARKTAEIARSAGARVLSVPWRHDFAAARNHLLARLTGHWILWLEPGERVAEAAGLR